MKAVSISLSKWPMLQTTARFFRALSMLASQTLTLPVVVTIRSILPSRALSMLASVPSLIPSMNGETSSKPSMHACMAQIGSTSVTLTIMPSWRSDCAEPLPTSP
ncbi:hypothetical protein D3C78_1507950 [compost metagenome]